MWYFRLSIIFIFYLTIAAGLQVAALPSAQDHPLTLQLVDSPLDEPQHHSLPHKKPPKDIEKTAPKAAAKPDMDIMKNVGAKIIKNADGAEKYFTEVLTGYKQIYTDGISQANEKRNNRIAHGEKPTFFTDFIDGFTSTFIPSAKFTFTKLGLPVLKIFGYAYFGITTP
jgi:hypothetical protein